MDICNEKKKWKSRGKDMTRYVTTKSGITAFDSDYEEPYYFKKLSDDGRHINILDLVRIASVWPVQAGSHNASFSMELFSMNDVIVEPFKDFWIDTGYHLKYDKNLQGDFFVSFKGWRLTDKVVTRDRIIDITKPPSIVGYFEDSTEFQVNLLNFAPTSFHITKGMPVGRIVLSSHHPCSSSER